MSCETNIAGMGARLLPAESCATVVGILEIAAIPVLLSALAASLVDPRPAYCCILADGTFLADGSQYAC